MRRLSLPGPATRALISFVLIAGLVLWLSTSQILATISQIRPRMWVFVVGTFLLGHGCAAMKWRFLVTRAGGLLGRQPAAGGHAAGLFANLCLPSIVGGDVIRAGVALRSRAGLVPVTIAGLADRLIDTLALVAIAGFAAILNPGMMQGDAGTAVLSVGVALTVGAVIGLMVARRVPAEKFPQRLKPGAPIRDAIDSLLAEPGTAATALTISIGIQGMFIALNVALGGAIGIELDLAAWMLAWPLAKLVALLPISLGGIGVREVALAAFLSPFGVPPELAVAQSLAWEAVLVLAGLIAGGISLMLIGRASFGTLSAVASP